MSRRLAHHRPDARRLPALAIAGLLALAGSSTATAGTAEGKEGLVELGRTDPRLRGHHAPKGFRVQVVADSPALASPAAMAFDDQGQLYVAEWRPANHTFDAWDTIILPEGGTARLRRDRKSTADVVKRLRDLDGDGTYESAEVVIEGVEMPSSILPWKNSLYLTCVGRLERWSDEDGDGKFETRAVVADGFAGADRRGLSGMTLGSDGWLYLTVGDGDCRVVGPDDARIDLPRNGGVFRCRVDGSKLQLFAMGLRNPYRDLAFNADFEPFLVDGDDEDGTKFQGVRLINPVEMGDYGWRLRPGAAAGAVDFDRAAVDGERPGKLPAIARLGRGRPSGVAIYNGTALPDSCRGLILYPDPLRRTVRGLKVAAAGGSQVLRGSTTLMTADDDRFRPCQATVGADGAVYILDQRLDASALANPWGDGKSGRIYRITWEGDGITPALPTKPNNWQRVFQADFHKIVFEFMAGPDLPEAERALRELIDRGPTAVGPCLGWATNAEATLTTRLLGIQGARQLWSDPVEAAMVGLLKDAHPEVRRLAAQALAWEPKTAVPRLVPKLLGHLEDPDGRVVREVALAIGRHAEPRPHQAAATLLRWLYAHPGADAPARDGFLRALERLGEAGVEEVALAVRTRRGTERETAVALFAGLRSAPAAEQLADLVKVPDLTGPERLALIRQLKDIPLDIPVPTQGLADWVARHGEVEPAVKVAALDACRLAGNPASGLVLALLDDADESVRLAAIPIAAQSRPPGALDRLGGRLIEADRPGPEKLAIVRSLRAAGPTAFRAVEAGYRASADPAFRRAALRTLVEVDRGKALPEVEAALASPDPGLRAEAIRILGETPQSAVALGKSYLARPMARTELPEVLAGLRKHDGAEPRRVLAAVEDAARRSAATDPAEIRSKVANGGDPWTGLGVFFKDAARCSDCHKVEGYGIAVGPPLAGIPVDRLVDSILDPSREIKTGYEAARLGPGRAAVATALGKDGGTIRLPPTPGPLAGVARDPGRTPPGDGRSIMPADLALGLTPGELVDLVAFLLSKPAQDSLKHGPRRLDRVLAIGPFATGADKLRIPLDRVDPARPMAGQDGSPASWVAVDATGSGIFNLRGEFGPGPGRAFLAVQVRSAREQSAALRFGVEGASRVYLNGAKVADIPEREPADLTPAFARPASGKLAPLPDLARLPLKPGWNLLIVALDRSGTADARAAFEIASPEPVEIRSPRH